MNRRFQSFSLGQVVATRSVAETIPSTRLLECLNLHAQGQWGHLTAEDAKLNDLATIEGDRILSCYAIDPRLPCEGDNRLWCLTEYDRSYTTLMRPSEY